MKKHIWFSISLLTAIITNIVFTCNGIFNVVSQLFYVPILLVVFYHKKRGMYLAIAISALYFSIEMIFDKGKINLIQAIIRSLVFISIALLVYLLNERNKNAESELDSFFNINADMMCCANQAGYFVRINKAFQEVLGYQKEELENKRFIDFIHPEDIEATKTKLEQLKENISVNGFINRYRCKDGTYKYIEWNSSPKGKVTYSSARDITNRMLAERLRNNTLKRYESLIKISNFSTHKERDLLLHIIAEAVMLTDSQYGYIFYPDEQARQFSLAACSNVCQNCKCAVIDYEGNSILSEVIDKKQPVIINDFTNVKINNFCFSQNFEIHNLLLVPVFEEEKIVAITGVFNKKGDYDEPDNLQLLLLMRSAWELVHRRRTEHDLRKERKWFETTLLSINDGVVATDINGTIRVLNSHAAHLTDSNDDFAVGKNIKDVFRFYKKSDHTAVVISTDWFLNQSGLVDIEKDVCLVTKDGDNRDLEINFSEIKSSEQDVKGYLFIFQDITQKNKDEEQIIYLTYHDKLTGLYNRRFFEEELKRIDNERNLPISVIMGDVNGLKLTNDAFGHLAGDELLTAAANVMNEVCRKEDIVARWGGDEYLILLPKTDAAVAAQIADRIKAGCAQTYVSNLNLSISLGCATKFKNDDHMTDVVKFADDIMYKSKLLESRSIKSSAVKTILKTLHEKNYREEVHSDKVAALCRQIALSMNLSKSQITDLELLGKIHDIGKISVDESILNKKGRLTPEEYEAVKRHSETGYHIISASPDLSYLANYVLAHHERWDGTGYPNGLKETDIPLMSRIICVADAFEAMTSERPYRKSLSQSDAIKELERYSKSQFDPDVVKSFTDSIR